MSTPWNRFVVVGDSFSEGMTDPDPREPDRFRGWADHLAVHLDSVARERGDEFRYANLAVRGRKIDDVVGPQLDAGLALKPDLISIIGGGNDLLRPSVDLDRLRDRLEEATVRARATGADVLLATPTDTRSAGAFRALTYRHAIHAANVFTIAQRHGAHVLNLWGMTPIRDWRMWAEDRVHPSPLGHERITQGALLALGFPVTDPDWMTPLPPEPAPAARERAVQSAQWLREHAAPWAQRHLQGRSSGDGLHGKFASYVRLDRDAAPPRWVGA